MPTWIDFTANKLAWGFVHERSDKLEQRLLLRPASTRQEVRQFKRRLLIRTLRECGWRKAESARSLGVARGYLHRLINQLEITQREDEGHNGNGIHGPNGAVAREKFPAPKQIM